LPDKVTALPYAQLLVRARTQAARANDAFYVDNYGDVEEAARGLEQTAQYLAKAEDVPAKHKDSLALMSADLGKLAQGLREAAAKKDSKALTPLMNSVNAKVREMRLAD
jgi:hypothetical protein